MRSQLLSGREHYQAEFSRILGKYGAEHPHARIETSRSKHGFVDIHIDDPDFAGMDVTERFDAVWNVLEELPEDVLGNLGTMRLLAPGEI